MICNTTGILACVLELMDLTGINPSSILAIRLGGYLLPSIVLILYQWRFTSKLKFV